MKVGDILYKVDWDIGFDPSHPLWDETDSVEEHQYSACVEVQTWRVQTVRRKPRNKTSYGLYGEKPVSVFIRRFDHGEGVRMKTRGGKVVGFEFDKTTGIWNHDDFVLGKRPDEYRPTKKGAFQVAIASVRKDWHYKDAKGAHEKMRKRLVNRANKLK